MKKRILYALITLLLLITCVLSSCNANQSIFDEGGDTTETDYADMIRELENKLIALQQNQYISDNENQKEIERLQNLLAQIKGETQDTLPSVDDTQDTTPQKQARFLYEIDGETAVITGYTGDDAHLVIPSAIDGYTVTGICDSAFRSDQLESIIITNGISKIGWFAFKDCPSLTSVTIPSSVNSIGYAAFDGQTKTFTIYCPGNSFAQKYAQSYGFAYTII